MHNHKPKAKDLITSGQQLEAASREHVFLGDDAFNAFIEKDRQLFLMLQKYQIIGKIVNSKTKKVSYQFKLPNGLSLTFGQICALAGDFYGDPEMPICQGASPKDQEDRFIHDFEMLVQSASARKKVPQILDAWAEEEKLIADNRDKKPVPVIIEENEKRQTAKYIRATQIPAPADTFGRLRHILEPDILTSRYTALLKKNYDHFAPNAQQVYEIGHLLAIETAREASKAKSEKEKYQLLGKALILEAYASHFGSDAFASGHMRVPREALPQYAKEHDGYTTAERSRMANIEGAIISGIQGLDVLGHDLAHEQHEEDGLGLYVTSGKNSVGWWAYGDNHFEEDYSADNRKMAEDMMQAGITDVARAFFENQLKTDDRLNQIYGDRVLLDYPQHWPVPQKPASAKKARVGLNPHAMFKLSKRDGALKYFDPHQKQYVRDWTVKQVNEDLGRDPLKEGLKYALGH